MPTRQENLTTALDNVASRLAEITSTPKPSYTLDGEQYSWAEYFQILTAQYEALLKAEQRAGGVWRIRTRAII